MARLGKVLLKLRLITPDQLKRAVAAQILYGGRLGTNLVELGFLDLDGLAQALAQGRGLPAALRGHFDHCDPDVQERVPAPVAERWKAVPLGRLAHDPSRIAIAAMDPLPPEGLSTLAAFLDVASEQLVQALSPELRILYHLERVYGVERGIRFLRIRNPEPAPLPEAPSGHDSDVEIEIVHEAPAAQVDDAAATSANWSSAATAPDPRSAWRVDDADDSGDGEPALADRDDDEFDDTRDLAAGPRHLESALGPPPALDYLQAPPLDDEVGRGQRRFVPSLGDSAGALLARIAVRQVISSPYLRLVEQDDRPRPTNPIELLRAVRRAASRDQVAELVVGGLGDLGVLDTVAILVVRPPIALGWRGYCPAGEPAIESLAVPLDQPGCLASIHAAAIGSNGAIEVADTTVIDQRMWEVFGAPRPAEVLVEPILLGAQVVCLLYGQAPASLGPARELGAALAAAAGIAFGRLLRAAQR